MRYTKEQIVKINKDFQDMEEFLVGKIREIGEKIGFLDKCWAFEDYDIDDVNNLIKISAFDIMYDQYDSKSTSFPLDWLFNDNWEEEWQKIEQKRIRDEEEAKAIKAKKAAEDLEKQELKELERLLEKYKK